CAREMAAGSTGGMMAQAAANHADETAPINHVILLTARKPPIRPLFGAGLAPDRPWPATAPPTFFP
ncbi:MULTISPECIES: hypothetical protein, partial [Rhizobium/Agrobacterium group]|uniref:hypothetical protein n=1 Tax=Rhizobium/Agrobacterium group TaxID=227290 RepID=UPI00064649AD